MFAPGWLPVRLATPGPGGASLPGGDGPRGATHCRELPAAGWDPAPSAAARGSGFPVTCSGGRLQELSCQTKAGNYPRLIHTFPVHILIEI